MTPAQQIAELWKTAPQTVGEWYELLDRAEQVLKPMREPHYDNPAVMEACNTLSRKIFYWGQDLGLQPPLVSVQRKPQYTPAEAINHLRDMIRVNKPKVESLWLTEDEAAAYAKMEVSQIREAVRLKQLTAGRGPRNTLRLKREAIDDYLQSYKGSQSGKPRNPNRKGGKFADAGLQGKPSRRKDGP